MPQQLLTRRALLDVGGARSTEGRIGLRARSLAGTPFLTRRLLVVGQGGLPGESQIVSDRDAHGVLQRPLALRFVEESEDEDGPLRLPVLGLGVFGVQVLTALASTRQTTALEWLSSAADPWAMRPRDLAFVVADWGEAASARQAAHLAASCRASGCLTVAIGPLSCGCAGQPGAVQAQAALAMVRPWVDCLVTCPPVLDQNGRCRPGWHATMAQTHTWAAQVIDGIADFLRLGMICVDLTDMRVLFTRSGMAMGGIGRASGPDRIPLALHRALAGPWLDAATLALAQRVLIMVSGSPDLTWSAIHETVAQVQTMLSPEALWLLGGLVEPQAPPETLQVMLLAGGLDLEAPATDGA